MDTKEEIIEEIDEMEDLSNDSNPDEIKSEEPLANKTQVEVSVVEPAIEEEILPDESNNENPVVENETAEEKDGNDETNDSEESEESLNNEQEQQAEELPKKNKAPIIVLLSILLVIDIAALVIYMIGIEKVISFIK